MICVVNVLILALSGLTAFLWKYFMYDFQGAFQLAGLIVAVTNGILVAYITKLQEA